MTARTSWPSTIDFGIHSYTIGDIGEVITGVSAGSLHCCRVGSGAVSQGFCVWPSRANDFILPMLPRLHRLVGSDTGAAGGRGGEWDRGSRRRGSVPGRPRGGAAAGRAGARSAGRRREGGRLALMGRPAAAGGRG